MGLQDGASLLTRLDALDEHIERTAAHDGIGQSLFALIAGQGLILSAAGIVIGLAVALGLAQTMTSMLVGVKARDPMTFVVVSALFLLVAATASVLAAHRAATVSPTTALRGE